MIRMRRLGIVLLALGLVTAAIYGTGAFSGLTAQRSGQVSVTGDASAYISLKPSDGANGEYASQNSRGELEIKLGDAAESGGDGAGVNLGSVTVLDNVFTITNQGAGPVGLWLTDKSDAVTFMVDGRSIEKKENAIEPETGKPVPVAIVVDTRQVESEQDLLGSMEFHADSTVKGRKLGGGSGSEDGEPHYDTKVPAQPALDPADGTATKNNGRKYKECGPDLLGKLHWENLDCHGNNIGTWGNEKKEQVENGLKGIVDNRDKGSHSSSPGSNESSFDRFVSDSAEYLVTRNPINYLIGTGNENGKSETDTGKRPIPDGGSTKIPKHVSMKNLNKKIAEANKFQGSKLDIDLTSDDIIKFGRDDDGSLIYLIDTRKWKQSEDVEQIPGWRHILARHGHPKSPHKSQFTRKDSYPVSPAQAADDDTSIFPKRMSEDDIQNLIMEAARNGDGYNRNPFIREITYDVPKNSKYYKKYGVEEMTVVIRRKSGLIKTAFPSEGGVKYKNI